MNRLKAAAAILAALFLLTLVSGQLVSESLDSLDAGLAQVEIQCRHMQYETAQEQLRHVITAYQKQQTLLAFFIRRDRLSELESALSGLSAYVQPDYQQDLFCETGKLRAQINGIRRLFFGLL